jgi:aminoglycoside phosphotransferase (APT) family kinase protein
MHPDEVATDAALVRGLVAGQFPQWAGLPVTPVRSAGTDHAIYRLGDRLAVRLPRIPWAVAQVDVEHRWLPRLAPHLPLAVPEPQGRGDPADGYPWPWSVYRWLDGENPSPERIGGSWRAALDLGRFVASLQRIDATGGPPSSRGVPLVRRDPEVRAALVALRGVIDTAAATDAWEAALDAPLWHGPPVWVHGDLHEGNLLARHGRLCAVIDFGAAGVGDPACDMMPAWTFLSARTRDLYRDVVGADDATWARGRGWALSLGLVALPYYQVSNPVLARIARRAIDEALGDVAVGA